MTLTTDGIDIDKLDFTPHKIIVKSLIEYQEDVKKTIDEVKKLGKKGIAIFRDNPQTIFKKPSLKIDF